MKKILPITFILLSVCTIVHAQSFAPANRITASPDLQQSNQDEMTSPMLQQQEQQLENKRLHVKKQLVHIRKWYDSQTISLPIKDGWHSAYATDNDLYVSPVTLNVIGGKVAIIGKTEVSTSTSIERGRCRITAMGSDNKMHILNVYFLQ